MSIFSSIFFYCIWMSLWIYCIAGKINLGFFCFPSHKIRMLNSVYSIVVNPVWCMNSPLGGVKPSRDWLSVHVDCPYPPPPSHDWCMMRTALHLILVDMLAYLNWVLSTVLTIPRITGAETILIVSHPSSSSSSTTSLLHQNPTRKSKLILI